MSTLFTEKKKLEIIITAEDPVELFAPASSPPPKATRKENKNEKCRRFFPTSWPPLSQHDSGLTYSKNPPAEVSNLLGSIHIMGRSFWTDGLNSPDYNLNVFPPVLTKLPSTTWAGPTIIWPSAFHFPISVRISTLTEGGGKQALD